MDWKEKGKPYKSSAFSFDLGVLYQISIVPNTRSFNHLIDFTIIDYLPAFSPTRSLSQNGRTTLSLNECPRGIHHSHPILLHKHLNNNIHSNPTIDNPHTIQHRLPLQKLQQPPNLQPRPRKTPNNHLPLQRLLWFRPRLRPYRKYNLLRRRPLRRRNENSLPPQLRQIRW